MVDQTASDPRWPLQDYTIDIDPRSRMYDPYDPDREPMPPDDPTAHQLMHHVNDMKGYSHWHDYGDTPYSENPCWLDSLPGNEQGRLVLDADASVRLALLHSPDYQEELEELYLSALDVSFERFRFDSQFFAGYSAFFTADGRDRAGLGGQSSSELELSTFPADRDIRVQKLFSTGAELVVGFANSLVWQFSGPDTNSANSLLDFSLIQPLLRRAGRDVVLERLTISERALLSNVRQMERFRRGFYYEVVTGEDAGAGPERRGGFFGGSGLEGFSGVGGGGFGRVGGFGFGFGGTGFDTGGAGAGLAGGFFGLLQVQQSIRNQESTIASLRNSLAQIEAFYAADRIDFLQVQQSRQALFTAQSQLLISRAGYQASLDRFKGDLGLPPQIDLVIDESFVGQFDLIDSAMVSIQNRLTDLQQNVGGTILRMLPPENDAAGGGASGWNERIAMGLRQLQAQVAEAERIRAEVAGSNIPQAWSDINRLKEALPRRRKSIEMLQRQFAAPSDDRGDSLRDQEAKMVDDDASLGVMNVAELEQLPSQLEAMLADQVIRIEQASLDLVGFEESIAKLLDEGPMLAPDVLAQRLQMEILAPVPNELTELSAEVLELLLIQARARTESSTLVHLELDSADAFEIARVNRRDWMNARANLIDTWRLIGFNANDLESDLDIVFSGDISNVGDNPLDLRSSTGRLRVGIQFDSPLTRVSERNIYREALIEYQQARRDYYEFVDRIARGLRETIRTIELNQINFELRRAAVQVAIAQVELARLRLQEPPKPAVEETVFGPTTANDLVQALGNLLQAQDDFLSVFIDYEVQRRELDFDLGTMQLDAEGVWIDPGPIGADNQSPEHLPPPGHSESIQMVPPDQPPANQSAVPNYRGLLVPFRHVSSSWVGDIDGPTNPQLSRERASRPSLQQAAEPSIRHQGRSIEPVLFAPICRLPSPDVNGEDTSSATESVRSTNP